MAVSLGEAILKIGADSSTFERKMGRLKGLAVKQMDSAAAAVMHGVRNVMLAGAAAIAAGVAAVISSVNYSMEYADELDKMSLRTGLATEALAKLKYMAALTGTSIEGVETAIRKMQKAIYGTDEESNLEDQLRKLDVRARDLRQGYEETMQSQKPSITRDKFGVVSSDNTVEIMKAQEKATRDYIEAIGDLEAEYKLLMVDSENATKAFIQLGLNQQSLKTLSTEQQFDIMSGALAEIPTTSERAALAMTVFGKAGTQLLPMLASGKDGIAKMKQEAIDLGIIMSDADVQAGVKLKDNIERLKTSINGLRLSVGTHLIPTVDKYIKVAKEWVIAHRELIAGKVKGYIDQVVAAARKYGPAIQSWIEPIKTFLTFLANIATETAKVAYAVAQWGIIRDVGVWLKDHPALLGKIVVGVVAIAAAWKAVRIAALAYGVAATLAKVGGGAVTEAAAKNVAAGGSGSLIKAALGTAAMPMVVSVAAIAAGALAGIWAGKKAFDTGLANEGQKGDPLWKKAVGAVLGGGGRAFTPDEEQGMFKTGLKKIGSTVLNPVGAMAGWLGSRTNRPTEGLLAPGVAEKAAKTKSGQETLTTIQIQNLNVNAADMMTAKNAEKALSDIAKKKMP